MSHYDVLYAAWFTHRITLPCHSPFLRKQVRLSFIYCVERFAFYWKPGVFKRFIIQINDLG